MSAQRFPAKYIYIFLIISATLFTSSAGKSSDEGGNRGWGVGFGTVDQYASVGGYFNPSPDWPTHNITGGGKSLRSFALTMIANGDSNHVQPFIEIFESTHYLSFESNFATANSVSNVFNFDSWTYWNKWTVTYSTTGQSSITNVYINGTRVSTASGTGKLLRWSDSSTLLIGGYSLSSTNLESFNKFVGWIDDLSFYNRVLSPHEISSTWNQAGDVSDKSMCLYYNFDEGPGAKVFKNRGVIGSQADLLNGKVFGGSSYFEVTSQVLRMAEPAVAVPGAPVVLSSFSTASSPSPSSTPITVSVDASKTGRIHITCNNPALTASSVSIKYLNGTGQLYQTSSIQSNALGTKISSFPTVLSSTTADVWYVAPANATRESFSYTCICSGPGATALTQPGQVVILVTSAPVADPSLLMTVVAESTLYFPLIGTNSIHGIMQATVTKLPVLGRLYQWNISNPIVHTASLISSVPTVVINPWHGLIYDPLPGAAGTDSLTFTMSHSGITSAPATLTFNIQSWNYPPHIPSAPANFTVLSRKSTSVQLAVKDNEEHQYIDVYITSLPKKGKLYQRSANGTRGAQIISAFSPYKMQQPAYQFATSVLNVSSFWGGSRNWSPLQALNAQDCFAYGDCKLSWCPLTPDGTGGPQSDCGNKLCYSNNPDALYELYGYTEYIELGYDQPVFVSELLIGENRGMGAVKNILAKDPAGNWMTVYTVDKVDPSVQALYAEFNQYRKFQPSICHTMFSTSHLRFEMDTRSIPDWNEWDFFRLGGTTQQDPSVVTWTGKSEWSVIYEPDPTAAGTDSFTYSANDCPVSSLNWSPNPGIVSFNIVPSGTAGSVRVGRYETKVVDLSQWSVAGPQTPLVFTVTSLPSAGTLFNTATKVAILTTPSTLSGSNVTFVPDSSCAKATVSFAYLTTDPRQTSPVSVIINVNCPRACQATDVVYSIGACHAGVLPVTYAWNATAVKHSACVPDKSVFTLPSPYMQIPCADVAPGTAAADVATFYAVLVSVSGLVFMSWMGVYRHLPIVKLSQPGHTAGYCCGAIALQWSWLSFVGPLTDSSCLSRIWPLALSYSSFMGFLIRKVYIVMEIVWKISTMARTHKHMKFMNQLKTVGSMAAIWAVDCVILGVMSGVEPPTVSSRVFAVPTVGNIAVPDYQCKSGVYLICLYLVFLYKLFLTLFGAALAFRVRSVDDNVSESSMMLYSTYNLIVSVVLIVVVQLISTLSTGTILLLGSSISCFAMMFSLSALFLPKMYIHFTGQEVNLAAMFGKKQISNSFDSTDSASNKQSSNANDANSDGSSKRIFSRGGDDAVLFFKHSDRPFDDEVDVGVQHKDSVDDLHSTAHSNTASRIEAAQLMSRIHQPPVVRSPRGNKIRPQYSASDDRIPNIEDLDAAETTI